MNTDINKEYIKKELEYQHTKNSTKFVKPKNKKKHKIKYKSKKCMTCEPRGKVLKHIIKPCISEDVNFHHDMHNRNLIIVTPKKHYMDISEFNDKELKHFFETIKTFCNNWNLEDYNISFNNGEWKNQDHFHVKIKILEKIATRMRNDYFRILKLQKEYTDPSAV